MNAYGEQIDKNFDRKKLFVIKCKTYFWKSFGFQAIQIVVHSLRAAFIVMKLALEI